MMVQKGVYDLIAACKILQEKGHIFHCHFVGAWSDISETEIKSKVIQEGLSDVISFHGKKVGPEKAKIFNNADIFILPSHNECFPLVNLEAMQFSLPVITTTVGGIPDMVINGETGFLIPPKDPSALAEKLDQLIQDPEMRIKMGLAGRKFYEASFTMKTFEVKMKNILETAIDSY
jgi:glycosyltransferase involved in cell wall biosynthesis